MSAEGLKVGVGGEGSSDERFSVAHIPFTCSKMETPEQLVKSGQS